MGRNEYGISGHLHIFAFLKHLMVLLSCIIFRASFLHLIKETDSIEGLGHVAQILKEKSLLNDGFKVNILFRKHLCLLFFVYLLFPKCIKQSFL